MKPSEERSIYELAIGNDGPLINRSKFYKENGYLTYGRIFTKAELDTLRDYVDEMIENLPQDKRPEQMDVPHFEHPFFVQVPDTSACVEGYRAVHRTGYCPLVKPFY